MEDFQKEILKNKQVWSKPVIHILTQNMTNEGLNFGTDGEDASGSTAS